MTRDVGHGTTHRGDSGSLIAALPKTTASAAMASLKDTPLCPTPWWVKPWR